MANKQQQRNKKNSFKAYMRTCVIDKETTTPISILGHTFRRTILAKKSRLLISKDLKKKYQHS